MCPALGCNGGCRVQVVLDSNSWPITSFSIRLATACTNMSRQLWFKHYVPDTH